MTNQKINNARRADIVALAQEVFKEYFESPPADPVAVLRGEEITYSFGNYGDAFDGLLEFDAGVFHVFCNLDRGNSPDSPRARFTLAHELGHYYIDEHRNALMSGRVKPHPSSENRDLAELLPEVEANLFAAYFLMPEGHFKDAIKRFPSGIACIQKLADLFKVSARCAAIRYVEQEVRPSAVIFWNKEGFCWKLVSSSLWRSGCRKSLEDIKAIPHDSATGKLLNPKGIGSSILEEGHSLLGAWFPYLPNPIREEIVSEQAWRLGDYGVLTLIELKNNTALATTTNA